MRIHFTTTVALALLLATPAAADWPNTRWGMTVDEVQKVLNGKVVRLDVPSHEKPFWPEQLRLNAHEIAGVQFEITFFFKPVGGLSTIRFNRARKTDCGPVVEALYNRHGRPIMENRVVAGAVLAWWRDASTGTLISLNSSSVGCLVNMLRVN